MWCTWKQGGEVEKMKTNVHTFFLNQCINNISPWQRCFSGCDSLEGLKAHQVHHSSRFCSLIIQFQAPKKMSLGKFFFHHQNDIFFPFQILWLHLHTLDLTCQYQQLLIKCSSCKHSISSKQTK